MAPHADFSPQARKNYDDFLDNPVNPVHYARYYKHQYAKDVRLSPRPRQRAQSNRAGNACNLCFRTFHPMFFE